MADKPNIEKFLADPAFQSDRDLFNGLIDARLKHHAEEAEKARKAREENESTSIFDKWFGAK